MEKMAFVKLLFKIEEMLAEIDYWRRQINDCKKCPGWTVEDHKDLCPSCLQALCEEMEALKRLSVNSEMMENMMLLKEALDNDTTGELKGILKLARKTTVN